MSTQQPPSASWRAAVTGKTGIFGLRAEDGSDITPSEAVSTLMYGLATGAEFCRVTRLEYHGPQPLSDINRVAICETGVETATAANQPIMFVDYTAGTTQVFVPGMPGSVEYRGTWVPADEVIRPAAVGAVMGTTLGAATGAPLSAATSAPLSAATGVTPAPVTLAEITHDGDRQDRVNAAYALVTTGPVLAALKNNFPIVHKVITNSSAFSKEFRLYILSCAIDSESDLKFDYMRWCGLPDVPVSPVLVEASIKRVLAWAARNAGSVVTESEDMPALATSSTANTTADAAADVTADVTAASAAADVTANATAADAATDATADAATDATADAAIYAAARLSTRLSAQPPMRLGATDTTTDTTTDTLPPGTKTVTDLDVAISQHLANRRRGEEKLITNPRWFSSREEHLAHRKLEDLLTVKRSKAKGVLTIVGVPPPDAVRGKKKVAVATPSDEESDDMPDLLYLGSIAK